MRRRRYWIAGVVIAIIGLTYLLVYLGRPEPPGPGITWANIERIESGMTLPEVEAVVGCPPQAGLRGATPISANSPSGYHEVLLWSGAECDVLVYLDRDGRVIGREGTGSNVRPPTWLHRLCRRVGL